MNTISPTAIVRATLEAAANVDWSIGRDAADTAPDFLSAWQRGLVSGQTALRDAILAINPSTVLSKLVKAATNADVTYRRHGWFSDGQMDDVHKALADLGAAP